MVQVMRGVQKINSKTVTSSMLGNFRSLFHHLHHPSTTLPRDDPKTRSEFLSLARE